MGGYLRVDLLESLVYERREILYTTFVPGCSSEPKTCSRARLTIRGVVQGVGFRPFVYRLASDLKLCGWVSNSAAGVFVEVEGQRSSVDQFVLRIEKEKPDRSSIQSLEVQHLDPVGFETFEIRASENTGDKSAIVPPDIATCADCLRDISTPGNRRYLYPFTNCTNCGPRYTIIDSLPYDRATTSMASFTMCPECRAEYENPLDRRFHAQPNACPACGPKLQLWDAQGNVLANERSALQTAAAEIASGKIVAVKGLGGFHLIVLAGIDEAVRRLRERKHREEKPFAVMFPSIEAVSEYCEVNAFEERLLRSPEAPIVLLRKRTGAGGLSMLVAPGNPNLGAMIPYTPLHHLLMSELRAPVIATSANISDEPICTDETEALERLAGIADFFLIHNRPIRRPVDDSVARVVLGREMILRRARGYAPLPVTLRSKVPRIFATGAHLKNCVAVSDGARVFISQHLGDLETDAAYSAFQRAGKDLLRLYELQPGPAAMSADLHPDYLSTQFARGSGLPVVEVQHHFAHALSCMAENEVEPPALGVCWDGTGLGTDGTIWGGEFLVVKGAAFDRALHLRPFRLPGGDTAAREPRRAALGLLYELFGRSLFEMTQLEPIQNFGPSQAGPLETMLTRGLNSPFTSSAGRLFDAMASLLGIAQRMRFEGQAAMMLEFMADSAAGEKGLYPFELRRDFQKWGDSTVIDWEKMIRAILAELAAGQSGPTISAKFHNTLAEIIVAAAKHVQLEKVVLSGGCFQNRRLTESAVTRLREEGFRPYWHQRIPPNDGGIALGQIIAAAGQMENYAHNTN